MTPYLQKSALFPTLIEAAPSPNLGMIVVIPCYDEPDLLASLAALKKSQLPSCDVEVIVVINDSEVDEVAIKNLNQSTFEESSKWAAQHSTIRLHFHVLYQKNLPKKIAGVGTARKIGMDEAVRRLEKIGKSDGIIICFDADSQCANNYFPAIENHFSAHPKTQAAGIHFEHPTEDAEHPPEILEAIIQYELHLRYYVHAQRLAGFPHAVQTIGSSMAVRCDAYQQQGGMNKRKAGEDFYFIHKFTVIGAHSNITTTKVIPSPRLSHRVPFGTGKAVGEILAEENKYLTYHPQIFEDLRPFLQAVPKLFEMKKEAVNDFLTQLPKPVFQFLIKNSFSTKLLEIQGNTTNLKNFSKRFFKWFNAFLMMKYAHFARDHFYKNIPVEEAAKWLLENYFSLEKKEEGAKFLLEKFREIDLDHTT